MTVPSPRVGMTLIRYNSLLPARGSNKSEALMRKIAAPSLLLLIGMSAFVLTAATGPALAKKASAKARGEITTPAHYHYARDWKRHHRTYKVSRRHVRPRGYARAYVPSGYQRPPFSYETELLDCLMTQPFVICP